MALSLAGHRRQDKPPEGVPSPAGHSMTHTFPPPVWGRIQVGGKPALIQHPHPDPPPSRGRGAIP
jgi:hypothetical protein